ncbi:MAG TPA: 3-dehydroquinate synthase [Ktedonobacteraceae bacterium]|nr:3-dehydroquinate synthase [Ktedonobacteraceae bacterium]
MRNIFLIGLSGSGKSTIGRLLAAQLEIPLFDIDALVEEECGERIATLFAHKGEAHFRACESRALSQALRSAEEAGGAIIATGGGIVLSSENRQLMAEGGIRVYLAVEPATALQRLQRQQHTALAQETSPEVRPLLAGPDPLRSLQSLLADRAVWYEEAEICCSTEDKSQEAVTRELVAALIGMGAFSSGEPMLQRAHVGAGYDIVVEWGGLGRLAYYLDQLKLPPRIFLITDSNVERLYAASLLNQLRSAGYEPCLFVVPAGEASKSQEWLNAIYDWLLEHHAERREAIVALGGGVVGDMAGFAAATYLRGVPLVQVPTSLLAQVDSAIGGKTGINHARGKNLIGAFYSPRLVLADPATLLTLPERERIEGWAEVVKYGIILDTELFTRLEDHAALLLAFRPSLAALICQIIARSIALKVEVIEQDEREQGLRAILNYGHTVAHALENVSGYGRWLHGEAVSLGMVVAAALAQQAGMFSAGEMERQNRLLQQLGLPVSCSDAVPVEAILAAMRLDKKVAGKRIHWIMPERIGQVTVTPMPEDLVQRVITTFFAEKRP